MSDWWFTRPVRPPDRTEQEKIQVPPIEEEKRIKEKFEKEQREKEGSIGEAFYYAILRLLKRLTEHFSLKEAKTFDLSSLLSTLIELRKSLYLMQDQDQSQNAEFIQKLSDAWNLLKEIDEILETIPSKKIHHEKIKAFMHSFDNYPPKSDHSLGFYLTKHAGKDWLPFPFMEILKQIHVEFLEMHQESHLSIWITQLDEIIQTLLPD